MFISCAVCWRRKNLYFSFCVSVFSFIIFLMCSSERLRPGCDGSWNVGGGGGEEMEGGREEKGRVLGQADRDVSTASVIW